MKKLIKRGLMLVRVLLHADCSPKVLFYHDAGTQYTPMGTSADLFWAHMSCLHRLHVVAFDDGFRGLWDERESFRERSVRPLVFLAVSLVGQPGYLTWDEIRTLQNEYGFDFQCHTWSHQTLIGPCNPDLPIPESSEFRTDDWYHHELVDAKNELEKQLGKTVDALCFPVGNFSDDVLRRCAAAGYTRLYASYPGNIDEVEGCVSLPVDGIKLIPRNLVQDFSLFDFKLALKGGLMAFRKRYYAMHKFSR